MNNINRNVLFVHDGPLYVDEETGRYYGIHYDDKLIARYSKFGTNISFLMRKENLNPGSASKYSLLTYKDFNFIPIPNFKSFGKYLRNKPTATRVIKDAVFNNDIIVIRFPSAAGVIAINYARLYKKPVFIEMVACVFDSLWNYDWRGKLLAHYKYFQYKRLVNVASHVHYVTEKFLQTRYPTNGKSLACSDVDIKNMKSDTLNRRLDHIDQSGRYYTLGTIAALDVPYKGQKDVIKALGILKKEGVIFNYKLVGQGDPSYIKAHARQYGVDDQIEILGPIPHDKIFEFLEGIDIYIQPSKQEGLPRAMIEAITMVCPALGARTGGIPELIKDEAIFSPGNINQIIDKLREVNKTWLRNQAIINFDTAQKYKREDLDRKLQNFYSEFLTDWNL